MNTTKRLWSFSNSPFFSLLQESSSIVKNALQAKHKAQFSIWPVKGSHLPINRLFLIPNMLIWSSLTLQWLMAMPSMWTIWEGEDEWSGTRPTTSALYIKRFPTKSYSIFFLQYLPLNLISHLAGLQAVKNVLSILWYSNLSVSLFKTQIEYYNNS